MTKRAMVTGASSGIGLAFAQRLARENWSVTIVARGAEKLEELRNRLGSGEHRVIVADLSTSEDTERVAKDVRASSYDLLVNNAGVGVHGQFADTPLEKQVGMMSLNIDAVVALAHTFLASGKKGDALLNMSSSFGMLAFPGAATYCASKAFVTSFSESLWWEMKDRGVYVAAVLPGVAKMPAGANFAPSPEQVVDEAMSALTHRSSPTIVTGFANKALLFSTRFMPRKQMVSLMEGFAQA